MKKLFVILALLLVNSLFAEDFAKANAIMQSATRTRALTAKTSAQAKADFDNFDKLIASANAHISALKKEIAQLQNLKNIKKQSNEEIAKEIENNIANLNKLSKFLDNFYAKILNELPKKISQKDFCKIENFKTKTTSEKLRTVVALLEHLKNIDNTIALDKDMNISTGVFTSASGKISSDVSKLKVERSVK